MDVSWLPFVSIEEESSCVVEMSVTTPWEAA